MTRQQILTGDPPPRLRVVVDESVLRREVGPEIMCTELKCRKTHAAEQRWQTIRFALESWDRTARLCVITLVMSVPVDTLAWLLHRR
jgi:hypothetical protein